MKIARKILTFVGDSMVAAMLFLILLAILLPGCVPLTADQIADRQHENDITREKYYVCKDAWSSVGKIWYEKVHSTSRLRIEPSPIDMRVAITANGCGRYLRALGY